MNASTAVALAPPNNQSRQSSGIREPLTIDDQSLGVFLIEGAVRVSNTAGAQTLNQPGQGTNIARRGAAPGPITFWPQDKVNRAIAAVTFQ